MLKFDDEAGPPPAPEPSVALAAETIKGTPYSEAENTILRAAFKSGDKGKVAEAHAQIAATRSGEKTDHEAPAGQDAGPTDPQTVQPPGGVDTTSENSGPLAEFTAQTGGVVDGANLELLGKHTEPWVRSIDEISARFPDNLEAAGAALAEHVNRGEERVLRDIYHGSEQAFKDGMKEVDAALDLLPNGAVLREALNLHFAMADVKTHQHVLTLARLVTKKLGKK